MYSILLRSAFSMLAVGILIFCFNDSINFAQEKDARMPVKQHQDVQSGPGGKDVAIHAVPYEEIEERHIKCLQELAKTAINMLIATRGVIAKNQELINRDPASGNYSIKGFVPAVVGSQVANDFSLMTGHRLKQTSLKIRNPSNAPDEWEKKVLKLMESQEYPKDVGFGEILGTNGKRIYRYIKPIYVETACLQCHGNKSEVVPAIRQFLERRYPYDEALGYKYGDFRGGISIIISLERLGIEK